MNTTISLVETNVELGYSVNDSIDTMWILICGFLVFFMQTGFAMLEVGSVRVRSAQNILLKNVVDVSLGGIIWWLFGYAFAYGESFSSIIGGRNGYGFAGYGFDTMKDSYRDWFFQWAFATTTATIVSGALAERTKFIAYIIYSCLMTAIIYPVIVHWTWGGGWLSKLGYNDFAGSGIVHMVGGMIGLVGAYITKPRLGRFLNSRIEEFKPHNVPLCILGTLILWVGWYGFNCGSTLGLSDENVEVASKVAVNTSISATIGGLVVLFVQSLLDKFAKINNHTHFSVVAMINGILAGLVSVTAPCGNITSYAALVIGLIGALIYIGFSQMVVRLRIDDPLDAFAVHYGAGLWGVISVGLFDLDKGLFYSGSGLLLGIQFLGALVITVWCLVWGFLIFFLLSKCKILRISEEEELKGIDNVEHGGNAYHFYSGNVDRVDKNEVEMTDLESKKSEDEESNVEEGEV